MENFTSFLSLSLFPLINNKSFLNISVSLAIGVARWYIYYHTKNHDLGIIWRALEWKLLEYF
jgi:hypothetical protein